MATVVRSALSHMLDRDLDSVFMREASLADQSETRFLNLKTTSDDRFISQQFVGPEPPVEKTEGASIQYSDIRQLDQLTIYVKTFARGLRISQEALEDGKYNVIGDSVRDMATLCKYKRLQDAAAVWNNGFAGGQVGSDGQQLFATAHVRVDSTTWSNMFTTGLQLSITNLETALVNLRKQTDERNLRIPATQGIVLHVPPDLEYTALNLVQAPGRPGVFSNDVNVAGRRVTVEIDDFLTDTDNWFLQVTGQHKCIWIERLRPQTMKGGDFDTTDSKFAVRMRYYYGFESPRGVYGSNP